MTRSQSLSKAEATCAGITVCVRPLPTKEGETTLMHLSMSIWMWSDILK